MRKGYSTVRKLTSTTVELFSVFSTFIMTLLVVFLFFPPLKRPQFKASPPKIYFLPMGL